MRWLVGKGDVLGWTTSEIPLKLLDCVIECAGVGDHVTERNRYIIPKGQVIAETQ